MNETYENPIVDPRIHRRHPEITESDVQAAWRAMVKFAYRQDGSERWVALGFDHNGRELELVFSRNKYGRWVIFHALTPPTKGILKELGLYERRL